VTQPPLQPDPFEMDDAPYLLGALSPAERVRYEQHLQTCEACSRSLTELAGVPGMLRRLPVEVVQSMDPAADGDPEDWTAPPPSVLAGVLERAELEDRRARRVRAVRWAGALTTAAAAVVVGVLAFVLPDPAEPPPDEPPPTAQLDFEALVPTQLSANVSLRDVAWGTRIELECAYPLDGAWSEGGSDVSYALVVHEADGDSEQVATWNAVAGRELTIDAATAVRGRDIASIEIRAEDGTPLLRTVH
jgi:Putative zinc-finger